MVDVGRASTALRQRLEAALAERPDSSAELGDALLSFAGLLDARPSVRRALTNTGRDADDRQRLARRLLQGRLSDAAVDVIAAAVGERWSRPSDLAAALEQAGLVAQLVGARAAGQLETTEDEIFRFGQVVRGEPALRSALLDRSAPADARRQLLRRLLDGRATPTTLRLVEHAVLGRRGGSLEGEFDRLTALAADLRQRKVAVVRVAAPLRAEHQGRLERALAAQAGMPVQVNVVVEPGLVGGIKVEIGDEVVDGTVVSRLSDAHRQLSAGR